MDDFIFTGIAGKGFEQLKSGLRERFRWGSCKLQSFCLCGVRVHKNVDHMIVLDQTSYVHSGINSISVDTHRGLDRSLTPAEIKNLRGVWSAIQWKVTQTGTTACRSVEVSCNGKSSQTHAEIDQRIKQALCPDVKLNETHLTIHPFSRRLKWNDLALSGYTDAAQGDRIDGSSTGGYVWTMAPYRQLIEGHVTDLSLIGWSTNKLKRVARSSLSAEIQRACNTDDELSAARLLWSEINGYQVTKHNVTDAVRATPGIIVLDANRVYDAVQNSSSTPLGLTEQQSGIELMGLQDYAYVLVKSEHRWGWTHWMTHRPLDKRIATVS